MKLKIQLFKYNISIFTKLYNLLSLYKQYNNRINFLIYFLSAIFIFSLSGCNDKSKDKTTNPVSSNNIRSFDNSMKAVVTIYKLNDKSTGAGSFSNPKNKVGTVTFKDGPTGLLVQTELTGIEPGEHGFHIHSNPSCDSGQKDGELVLGLAAGAHLDPDNTNKHLGPNSHEGHLGDLPVLRVDESGKSEMVLLAPKLKLSDLKERSVIIHDNGDNYSDEPKPLGGGGSRKYCGVIDSKAFVVNN